MIGASIGRGAMSIINAMVRGIASFGVHPNILTTIGVCINVGCGLLFGFGEFFWAGIVLIVANIFDMLDGNVARQTGNVTRFGGFLDSTLDRYSESVVFLGVLWYILDTSDAKTGALLVFIATVGSLMISYARARAEALGWKASAGLVARPERVILLAICLLAGKPMWALWALAVLTHITAATRIIHVWRVSLQETGPAARVDGAARSNS